MTFEEILNQAIALLQRQGRVSYRALKRQAEREHFLTDWQLLGSMTLLGDLESTQADIAKLFRMSLERTSRQLAE